MRELLQMMDLFCNSEVTVVVTKNKAIDIEIHLYAYACLKALKHLLGRPKSLFKFFIAYETPEQIFGQPNKKGEFYQMAQWYRIHLPVQETQET